MVVDNTSDYFADLGNASVNSSDLGPVPLSNYFSHLVYIVLGPAMIIFNTLLVLTIVVFKSMRKRRELWLIAGLASTDVIYGLGTLLGGLSRLIHILKRTEKTLVIPWFCMRQFQTSLFLWGGHTSAAFMFLISLDRFMAVRDITKYLTTVKSRSPVMLGVGLAYGCIMLLVCFLASYFETERVASVTVICLSNWALPNWLGSGMLAVTGSLSLCSVLIYLGVGLLYKRYSDSIESSVVQQVNEKRQKRLTVTLGMVAVCTLMFHTSVYLTIIAYTFTKSSKVTLSLVVPYLWMMERVNSLVNLFIFISRQHEFRTKLKLLVSLKRNHPGSVTPAQVHALHCTGNMAWDDK